MSNALIYHIASGQAFFSGVAFIHLAAILSPGPPGRARTIARTISALLGLLLIVASATPLPRWFYAVAVIATLAWLLTEDLHGWTRPRTRRILLIATLAAWWLGLGLELPYHLTPRLPRMGHPALIVLGDSLTAGMGGEAETWPEILARLHAIDVHDLSLAGATVSTAKQQAVRGIGPGALVLVEIGGNDILGESTPATFETHLDAILSQLKADKNIVVMLELPLPPTYNTFGEIQRRLARRHGVYLIPRRLLLKVLVTDGSTLDSIHLTRAGHSLMAASIWRTIKSAYQ